MRFMRWNVAFKKGEEYTILVDLGIVKRVVIQKFAGYICDFDPYGADFQDDFVRKLQETVREVKASREMGARYMTFEEYVKEEREDAREEGFQAGRNAIFREMLQKGMSVDEISALINLDKEEILELTEVN